MKRRGRWTLAIALFALACAMAVVAWLVSGVQNMPSQRARVLAVDNSDLHVLGHVKYGTQKLDVEMLGAEHALERRLAGNTVRAQMELDSIYSPGDVILVATRSECDEPQENDVLIARSHWRLGVIISAFVLFAIFLVMFGGATGLNALSSFILCALVVWKVVVPLVLRGWNASVVALSAVSLMTALVMVLVGGFTKKTVVATGGSMLGVMAGLALAHLFGSAMGINGATLPFVQTLVYSGAAELDLADLFIAATVIASSGAMMDLAMDISAGVAEVHRHNPTLTSKELFASAIRIGRATVGTMTTTLLLAYSGGYLTLLMVFNAERIGPEIFLNSPIVAAEVAKTLVGSFSIVLVAPATALVASILWGRRR